MLCREHASAQKGDGFFKGLWKKATGWNFEGRDAINKPFEALSLDEVKAQGTDVWMDMSGGQAAAHENGGAPEYKFVHRETGAELIFDGDKHTIIKTGRYRGTANYINAADVDELTVLNSPVFVARAIGHFAVDMVPYYVLGGER